MYTTEYFRTVVLFHFYKCLGSPAKTMDAIGKKIINVFQ